MTTLPLTARAFVAVVDRGLSDKGFLWGGAAILGLFPLAAMLLPSGHDVLALRDSLAAALAMLAAAGTLLTVGAPTLSADYRSGRLAFFLARPLPPFALWAGRFCCGLVAALGVTALVLLPTILTGGRPWEAFSALFGSGRVGSNPWREPAAFLPEGLGLDVPSWLSVAGLFLLLLPSVGHLVGTIFRLRGLWTLWNILFVAGAGLAFFDLWTRMVILKAELGLFTFFSRTAWATIAAAALGGWMQLRWGGVEARRAHALQSVVLWILLGASLVFSVAESRRLDALGPTDLDMVLDLAPAPQGPWTVIRGLDDESLYTPTFAWNTATGEAVPFDPRFETRGVPRFSPDGRSLFQVLCPRGRDEGCRPAWMDLSPDVTGPRLWQGKPEDAPPFRHAAVTGSGKTLVTAEGLGLRLYRLPPVGSPLRSWDLPEGPRTHIEGLWIDDASGTETVFVDTATRRRDDGAERVIYALDPASDAPPRETARFTVFSRRLADGPWYRALCPRTEEVDGTGADRHKTCWVHSGDGRRLVLPDTDRPAAAPLADGRLVAVTPATPGPRHPARWTVLDPADGERKSFETPPIEYLGGEIRPGQVTVARLPRLPRKVIVRTGVPGRAPWENIWGPDEHWRTLVVDLDRGEVIREVRGYLPWRCAGRPGCFPAAGTPGADWVIDRQGFPYRLDPADGALTPVGRGRIP